MIAYVTLMRPLNCLMAAVAVFIGAMLVVDPAALVSGGTIYAAMLAAFLITAAGNAINDYFDVEPDRINRPQRPIVSGKISANAALAFSAILFLIGIGLSVLLKSWYGFAIAVINSLLLAVYSWRLKDMAYIGNIAVSYLVASTFLFGGAAFGELLLPGLLVLLAGLANFSREVVKDLEDVEGDRAEFIKRAEAKKLMKSERFEMKGGNAVLKYSETTARVLAALALLLAISFSPLPFVLGLFGYSYLAVVAVADIVFLVSATLSLKSKTAGDFAKASKAIKIGMFLGLVSFIVGILL